MTDFKVLKIFWLLNDGRNNNIIILQDSFTNKKALKDLLQGIINVFEGKLIFSKHRKI